MQANAVPFARDPRTDRGMVRPAPLSVEKGKGEDADATAPGAD